MTGAVIALALKNPAIAVPVSFASHFAQDVVPHWDYGVSRQKDKTANFFTARFDISLLIDFLIAVALMIILALMFPSQKWTIWACMVAAACPDLMWAYYRLYLEHLKRRKPHYDPLARLHKFLQWSQTRRGFLVEIIWFIAAWIIVLQFR